MQSAEGFTNDWTIGPYYLDVRSGIIRRGEKSWTLGRSPQFHLLMYILEHYDAEYTKDQIISNVWPGPNSASDSSLEKAASRLRDILTSEQGGSYLQRGTYRLTEPPRPVPFRSAYTQLPTVAAPPLLSTDRITQTRASSIQQPVRYIPYARNHLFKGRERELKTLFDESSERFGRRVVQVLAALPGLGTTSIAAEYAYRHMQNYSLIWWINALNAESLKKGYKALAVELKLVGNENGPDLVGRISAALFARADWLFIFDDASSADLVLEYLPTTAAGHILITSPARNWKGIATIQDVPPLEAADAISFLNDRLRQMPLSYSKDLLPTLALELSHIPSALEIASTYIEQTGCPIDKYLERLVALRAKSFVLFGYEHSAELTVAETWHLTLLRAECECPMAFILLRFFEWLDDCEIPMQLIEVFDATAETFWSTLLVGFILFLYVWNNRQSLEAPRPPLPPVRPSADLHTFRRAIVALERYSVIQRAPLGFTVPPLVKVIVRTAHTKRRQKFWVRKALVFTSVLARLSLDDNDGPTVEIWIRHLRKIIEHAETLKVPASAVEIRQARSALIYIEERLGNRLAGSTGNTPVTAPVRLTLIDHCVVVAQTARDLLPRYWALGGALIGWITGAVLMIRAMISLYTTRHGSHVFQPFGTRLLFAAGSLVTTFIFIKIHFFLQKRYSETDSKT